MEALLFMLLFIMAPTGVFIVLDMALDMLGTLLALVTPLIFNREEMGLPRGNVGLD